MAALHRAVVDYTGQARGIGYRYRIDVYLRDSNIDYFNDFDLEEFADAIKKQTGVHLDKTDWSYLIGERFCQSPDEWEVRFAELFIFGRLAELIAVRMKLPAIEAIKILGQSSTTAGAFQAIQKVLNEACPDLDQIAPSTLVVKRFSVVRDLMPVWAKFQVMSQGRLPSLQSTRLIKAVSGPTGGSLCIAVLVLVFFFLFKVVAISLVASLFATFAFAVALAWFLYLLEKLFEKYQRATGRSVIRMPKDINTFGDVARLISGERGGWCTNCDYDLTGSNRKTCPECGSAIWSVGGIPGDLTNMNKGS